MTTIPSVTFSKQSTVPNFPAELHECIDMTNDLRAWAAATLPTIKDRAAVAVAAERAALRASKGEESWKRAGGPATARERDSLDHACALLAMLADGRASSSYHGWVDRAEWLCITRAVRA